MLLEYEIGQDQWSASEGRSAKDSSRREVFKEGIAKPGHLTVLKKVIKKCMEETTAPISSFP